MSRVPKVALLLDQGRAFDCGILRGVAHYTSIHAPWVFLRPAAFYQQFSGFVTQSLEEIRKSEPDGIILNESRLVEPLRDLGIPIIVVPVHEITPGVSHLVCDNFAVAVMAADHLRSLGLKHFAFAGFDSAVWSVERCEAFRSRLGEAGHEVQTHLVPLSTRAARRFSDVAGIAEWLKSLPKPVGILGCNDEFTRSLAETARIYGLRVPEEIALIGVDNDELICDLSSPPLSSIAFAVQSAGYKAAELLDRLMTGRATGPETVVAKASHPVVRQSTDLLAIDDEEVVKAIRFIRENAHHLLPIRDVVNATLLSQRTLNNRFRRAMGHSVFAEINRQRAAHIARLLLLSDESITHIARSAGYEDATHMSRFFHRQMGVTPHAFRMRGTE